MGTGPDADGQKGPSAPTVARRLATNRSRSDPIVAQIASLVTGGPDDDCWADEDRALIRLRDGLQHELLMLAGSYRTVSYLVNGQRLPLEPGARRFGA